MHPDLAPPILHPPSGWQRAPLSTEWGSLARWTKGHPLVPEKLPCAICEQFVDHKLRTTYITFYVEEDPVTYRLRTCKSCTDDARNPFKEWGDLKQEDGSWRLGNSKVEELQEMARVAAMALPASVRSANGKRHSSSRRGESGSTSAPSMD